MKAITIKALVWDNSHKSFASPSKKTLWNAEGYTFAECKRHEYEEILAPDVGIQFDTPEIPIWPCSCGLYGATEMKRVLRYKWSRNSLIFVMNAGGNYEAWNGGLRCQKMQPIGIVSQFAWGEKAKDSPMHDYITVLAAGVKYFTLADGSDLGVYPYDMVKEWMKDTWMEHIGGYWGDGANDN